MENKIEQIVKEIEGVIALKNILDALKKGQIADPENFATLIKEENVSFAQAFMIGQTFERMRDKAPKRKRRELEKVVGEAISEKLDSASHDEPTKHLFSEKTKSFDLDDDDDLFEQLSEIKDELSEIGVSEDGIKKIIKDIKSSYKKEGDVKVEFVRIKKK